MSSYLIGKCKRSPVNGHRLFCLKVHVNQDSLLWIHMLALHHIPAKGQVCNTESKAERVPTLPMYSSYLKMEGWVCLTWASKHQWEWPPNQKVQTDGLSPGRMSSNQCLRQRKNDVLGPEHTSCPRETIDTNITKKLLHTTLPHDLHVLFSLHNMVEDI